MNIFYPSVIIYVVCTQKNHLIDNICFGLEFEIILGVHSSHLLLICSSELPFFDWDSYFLKKAICFCIVGLPLFKYPQHMFWLSINFFFFGTHCSVVRALLSHECCCLPSLLKFCLCS